MTTAPARNLKPPGQKVLQLKSIWISDLHLGTPGCKAEQLLDFLRHHESENLYLVGDIIDGWELKKKWFWKQSHNDVVQKILRQARKGTKVKYIAGNHDEVARQFLGLAFGSIEITNETTHICIDGKKLWVVHGDLFDSVFRYAKWLSKFGSGLYNFTLRLNEYFNYLRRRMGFSYWSLSQYLKHKVKNAVQYITDFEETLVNEAKKKGYDGVICGHIHRPIIKNINGMLYCNDGDWVESMSALVETYSGELKIVYWTEVKKNNEHSQKEEQLTNLESF